MPYDSSGISPHDARCRREDYKQRHYRYQPQHLRQYEVARRVNAHNLQCVNLLRHAHGAKFRCDVRPHLAGKDETHDGTGELKQQYLARSITTHPPRHPRTLDVELHLYAYHSPDEKRNQEHYAYGVDAQLLHLLHILLPEHAETLGTRERATHQHQIPPESI